MSDSTTSAIRPNQNSRDRCGPKLTGQVWVGGLLGKVPQIHGKTPTDGPQMLHWSLDDKRLDVTDSLVSSWDNQFYPNIATHGSIMLQIDADTTKGGLTLNDRFFVHFGQEPDGPARPMKCVSLWATRRRMCGSECV